MKQFSMRCNLYWEITGCLCRNNSPDAFITLFCLQNPFEPRVLSSKNTSMCANTPYRAREKRQMVFIFAVDLKHIGKSQCFIWEGWVCKVRMRVCISAGA